SIHITLIELRGARHLVDVQRLNVVILPRIFKPFVAERAKIWILQLIAARRNHFGHDSLLLWRRPEHIKYGIAVVTRVEIKVFKIRFQQGQIRMAEVHHQNCAEENPRPLRARARPGAAQNGDDNSNRKHEEHKKTEELTGGE